MTESSHQSPFDDLRDALTRADQQRDNKTEEHQPLVRVDPNRARRAGIPEFVLAGNKASAEVSDALRRLVEANGRAMASRVRSEDIAAIQEALQPAICVEAHPG